VCDVIGMAQELSRRQLVKRAGTAAVVAAAAGATGPASALASRGTRAPRSADSARHRAASRCRTQLVLLGVVGGPVWNSDQYGVSSAVLVEDAVYVVDFGEGTWSQYRRALARDVPKTRRWRTCAQRSSPTCTPTTSSTTTTC
jgi:hypothetical protein